jgi:CheY-like chemotaxis protein
MVSDVLEYCGALVSVYQSADAAIVPLGEVLPGVLVCDLSMPGLDGLQFMRRLRNLPAERGGRAPGIAITAYYEDFAAGAALKAGFDAYMIKPIKLDELCRLVKQLATRESAGVRALSA